MDEYIKRDDAIHAICFYCRAEEGEHCDKRDECYVLPRLVNIPSADVVPRKDYESMERTVDKLNKSLFFLSTIKRNRAKWIYNDMSRRICSNCGNPIAFKLIDGNWYEGDFCPNCGADMREESEDIPMEYFESGGN